MWPVTGIFISSKVAVRIKVPESAEFFSYPLFSTRLGNRSKMQCTCTHIFRAPLAQLRRQLLPRSAPEPCQTRQKKQLRARSRASGSCFSGCTYFPSWGAQLKNPKLRGRRKNMYEECNTSEFKGLTENPDGPIYVTPVFLHHVKNH